MVLLRNFKSGKDVGSNPSYTYYATVARLGLGLFYLVSRVSILEGNKQKNKMRSRL